MKEICLGKISLTDEELNWFQAELDCGGIPEKVRIGVYDDEIPTANNLVKKGLLKTDNTPDQFGKISYFYTAKAKKIGRQIKKGEY